MMNSWLTKEIIDKILYRIKRYSQGLDMDMETNENISQISFKYPIPDSPNHALITISFNIKLNEALSLQIFEIDSNDNTISSIYISPSDMAPFWPEITYQCRLIRKNTESIVYTASSKADEIRKKIISII